MATVIDHAGYVITTPGEYILDRNLVWSSSTGAAITVRCSNVTIDLNGHTISGNSLDNSFAYGIRADEQTNVNIENGTIRGFFYGVLLDDNQAGLGGGRHDISNLSVLDCSFRGIRISGANSTVTDCYINGIGGTTNFPNSFAAGIELFGGRALVANNIVREVHPVGTGEGLGISISSNSYGSTVRDNTIVNQIPVGLQGFGIWVGGASTVTLQDNTIVNFENGFAFPSPTDGRYLGNTISGWYERPFGAHSEIVNGGGNTIQLTAGDDIFDINAYGLGPHSSPDGFTIVAQSGDDSITGSSANDTLMGGYGADVLDGGAGVDTASFADAAYGSFRISLADQSLNTGAALGDTYTGIENITLSRGNDIAYGDANVNVIMGQNGNDKLFGMDNDDRLFGENGTDILFGGNGADVLNGGAGFDYAAYDDAAYADFAVFLSSPSLNTGVAAGDTFSDIEGLILSSGNDTGWGNAAANYIYGRAGSDTIAGLAGNDTLFGELGGDTFLFNTRPNSTTNRDTIADFESGSDLIGLARRYLGEAEDTLGNVRLYEGDGITGRDVRAHIGAVLFDSETGALYYDADGAGAGAAIHFVTLTNVINLEQTDFFFV